ncbi:TRAP transporter substrate-binding protein DctP [Halarcobacter sp.]|uniref:TRAP transporter substrate-binding protein n=1 Tax=Halarcobacter sp. TaxID=2321133 RepID=UPI002AA8FA46|nr:TRAP transporter substrate-binding protein DctP [Halarcobacter sp.]
MGQLLKIVLLFSLLFSFSYAKKVYRLKMAASWGPTLSPLIDTTKHMAKLAEELSNGELKIRVDAANKHKAPLSVSDMVKSGQYDLGHTASYYWKGVDPAVMPFTSLPFTFTAPELYSWFYYGGGLELMKKVYSKHHMLSFPGGNTGMQMGGWFRKEIKSLEDLKGLKMRIPGFAGEVLAKLGVLVVNIPGGELYTSLERNTIDALEWVGPSMDIKMGFHRVAPYYYTAWHEPASEIQFLVNERTFNKLPEHLQKVLVTSFRLAAYDMYIQNYDMNATAWQEMTKEYPNIQVKTFPKDVMDALKKANQQLRDEMAAKNSELKEIFESQDAYMKKVRPWTEMSDYLYLKDNI